MAGRLSWTQVRAITRVATPADEQTYVELARHATGAQSERLVRGVRRAQKILEDEADPEAATSLPPAACDRLELGYAGGRSHAACRLGEVEDRELTAQAAQPGLQPVGPGSGERPGACAPGQ